MLDVDITLSSHATCATCGQPLLETPSGMWSCLKMCGRLGSSTVKDAHAQRLLLAISGETKPEHFPDDTKRDAEFIRSLPVAVKAKAKVGGKKRTVWKIGDAAYRRCGIVRDRRDIPADAVCAVLTPKSRRRVVVLQPVTVD